MATWMCIFLSVAQASECKQRAKPLLGNSCSSACKNCNRFGPRYAKSSPLTMLFGYSKPYRSVHPVAANRGSARTVLCKRLGEWRRRKLHTVWIEGCVKSINCTSLVLLFNRRNRKGRTWLKEICLVFKFAQMLFLILVQLLTRCQAS